MIEKKTASKEMSFRIQMGLRYGVFTYASVENKAE